MTKYFEIISASSPHIYHSALVVAPNESIVQKLYAPYAHPYIKVVCGVPVSWDTNTAATTHTSQIELAVWSPCNKFIAITLWDTKVVEILDSATLQHLQTLEFTQDIPTENRVLVFSPDSSTLTCSSSGEGPMGQELATVSWDLQTGGIVSVIRLQGPECPAAGISSLTYSTDGRMLGFSSQHLNYSNVATHTSVAIFDIASGIHIHSHSFNNDAPFIDSIWAWGEFLQFVTTDGAAIIIWEIGFTPGATPTKVETFPVPCSFEHKLLQFLPTPFLLAVVNKYRVQVWNVQNSECLLDCADTRFSKNMTFSPDGNFFACSTARSEIYLWKESPAGYILHEKLPSTAGYSSSHFSQNGKSIVMWSGHTIQLWYTEGLIDSPSTQTPEHSENFVLDFSPDGMMAVVAMQQDNMVTVLDLKSGVSQLTIDAGMEVYGLGVVGGRIFVIGMEKVITWDLPTKDCAPNTRASLEDGTWAAEFYGLDINALDSASISPDSCIIGFIGYSSPGTLFTFNLSSGECLRHGTAGGEIVQFSPDGSSIWCAQESGRAQVWKVDSTNSQTGYKTLTAVGIEDSPEGYPWVSSCGHQVTNDWWILGPDRKRLLMLPPPWRSHTVHRVWKGQFLVLLHCGLPEAVILDLNL